MSMVSLSSHNLILKSQINHQCNWRCLSNNRSMRRWINPDCKNNYKTKTIWLKKLDNNVKLSIRSELTTMAMTLTYLSLGLELILVIVESSLNREQTQIQEVLIIQHIMTIQPQLQSSKEFMMKLLKINQCDFSTDNQMNKYLYLTILN